MLVRIYRILQFFFIIVVLVQISCNSDKTKSSTTSEIGLIKRDSTHLVIIWSTDNKEIATKTALAYVLNSRLNAWIQDVTLLVWGPSVKLLANDKDIQSLLRNIKVSGVNILVDKNCVEEYGSTKEMEELGLETKSLGKPLSIFIHQKRTILTF